MCVNTLLLKQQQEMRMWIISNRRMEKSMSYRKNGFTLIELLVVIAIIALLLSILMPGLQKSKDAAKKVMCQANLHQQYLAFNMYQMENKGYYPTWRDPSGQTTDQSCAVSTYYMWGGIQGSKYAMGAKMLNPYIGSKTGEWVSVTNKEAHLKIFRCPSDNGSVGGAWLTSIGYDCLPTVFETLGSSYLYNSSANLNDEKLGLWNKKVADTKNANQLILVEDRSASTYFLNYNPLYKSYWHNRKELGWGNAAFVDGHVAYIIATKPVNGTRQAVASGKGWTCIFNKGSR